MIKSNLIIQLDNYNQVVEVMNSLKKLGYSTKIINDGLLIYFNLLDSCFYNDCKVIYHTYNKIINYYKFLLYYKLDLKELEKENGSSSNYNI